MKNKKLLILATITVACFSAYMSDKYDEINIGLFGVFMYFIGLATKEIEYMK